MRTRHVPALAGTLSCGLAALLCLASATAAAAPCAGFTDVDTTASYCAAVELLKNKGVISGCTASTYCPNGNVTRAEMALFMRRIARGGPSNNLPDATSSLGGGDQNTITGTSAFSTIAGGYLNATYGLYNVIGGGSQNGTNGNNAVIGGGTDNTATGHFSTIAGGVSNYAYGYGSSIVGGLNNIAGGSASVAAGNHAYADQALCTVFALWSGEKSMSCLGSTSIFRIGAAHGFSVDYYTQRDDGGGTRWVALGDIFAGQTISTWTGAYLTDGGTWTNASDRNAKTDIAEVDPQAVLDKVAAMPVSTWRYRNEAGQVHLGPMAQDFRAAFGLGSDDRHIATVDADGVALAAIKGLNAKGDARDARIAELAARNAALEARLAALERKLGD